MVQLMNYGKPELPVMKASASPAVKLEVEDQLEEEHGSFNKRTKIAAAPPQQQWEAGANVVPTQAIQLNLLNEPSPLGLRLRKSPSLLDLIQMKLSQAHAISSDAKGYESSEDVKIKDNKSASSSATAEKMKASNFPASVLRIGSWEYVSRYEGDLVAKCYFAKHKLVWEVLEGGLKSKMEIQWSDITALKATCPENEPGTLNIVLSRQPLFFRETNPQPRKHTLWQATSDFTDGQASLYRMHFLQCPPGLLNKHFEKLIQCDPRLYSLSQQPDVMLEKPFFEPRCSAFEEQDEPKCQIFNHLNRSGVEGYHDSLPCTSTSNSTDVIRAPVITGQEVPSPSSVMDTRVIEENSVGETKRFKRSQLQDQVRVPGMQPSMSMSDFMNQIGHCITEQMNSGNPFSAETLPNKEALEDLTQYLFSDYQNPASDEQSLMSRVNSFCNLLQKDGISVSALHNSTNGDTMDNSRINNGTRDQISVKEEGREALGSKQATSIPRRDSFGDLLMHLPRIASLPQFLPLFKISEDGENYDYSSPSS